MRKINPEILQGKLSTGMRGIRTLKKISHNEEPNEQPAMLDLQTPSQDITKMKSLLCGGWLCSHAY